MAESRLFAHMVVRNEEDRYLQSVLAALMPRFTAVHVHDDCSSDDTLGLAMESGAVCTQRDPGETSFAEHEGRFRYTAWRAFQQACAPGDGDWVLAVDADELLVEPTVRPAIVNAGLHGAPAVAVAIPEVFYVDDTGVAHVRTDGYWAGLNAPRLFPYRSGGTFADRAMACGSVPTYVVPVVPLGGGCRVTLAHLGYLTDGDRRAKFARYFNRPGHSPSHVASILLPPTLQPWIPLDGWRGRR